MLLHRGSCREGTSSCNLINPRDDACKASWCFSSVDLASPLGGNFVPLRARVKPLNDRDDSRVPSAACLIILLDGGVEGLLDPIAPLKDRDDSRILSSVNLDSTGDSIRGLAKAITLSDASWAVSSTASSGDREKPLKDRVDPRVLSSNDRLRLLGDRVDPLCDRVDPLSDRVEPLPCLNTKPVNCCSLSTSSRMSEVSFPSIKPSISLNCILASPSTLSRENGSYRKRKIRK